MDRFTMEKLKKIELQILIYIDSLCRENNLKYYLLGGTLLGAIRHKGFIPWDDDIDIGMMRDDYKKLINILNENEDMTYFVQNFNTDPDYPRYITKIRVNGTQFIEGYLKNHNMHHGIFIDIFPIDKFKNKNERKIDFRVNCVKKLLLLRIIRTGHIEHFNKKKVARIIRVLTLLIPLRLFNKLIDYIYEFENNKNAEYVTNFSSQYGWRKQTFPIDVYGEGTYLEFEGHQFMAPAKWEVILKSLYGDYMKLPPEEKRNSGHDVVHIDIGKYAEN